MKQKGITILKLILTSAILTILLLLVLAFLSYRFYLTEGQMETGVYLLYGIICLITGIITGKALKNRRFLWGAAVGFLYYLILLAVSCIRAGGSPENPAHLLITLAICVFCGMLGGMLGR